MRDYRSAVGREQLVKTEVVVHTRGVERPLLVDVIAGCLSAHHVSGFGRVRARILVHEIRISADANGVLPREVVSLEELRNLR